MSRGPYSYDCMIVESSDSRSSVVRGQWLCTTLYSGINTDLVGLGRRLGPNTVDDDGRLLGEGIADVLVGVEISVRGVLVASRPVDDVGDAPDSNE